MPRYFFDVKSGHVSLDDEGTVLADLSEARLQAIAAATDILKEDGVSLASGSVWTMSILDDMKQLVCTIRFSADLSTEPQGVTRPTGEP